VNEKPRKFPGGASERLSEQQPTARFILCCPVRFSNRESEAASGGATDGARPDGSSGRGLPPFGILRQPSARGKRPRHASARTRSAHS
jgi:hypothetical protein